jgi:hypothetical protein
MNPVRNKPSGSYSDRKEKIRNYTLLTLSGL